MELDDAIERLRRLSASGLSAQQQAGASAGATPAAVSGQAAGQQQQDAATWDAPSTPSCREQGVRLMVKWWGDSLKVVVGPVWPPGGF